MPFDGFDFTNFWDDCDYAIKAYVCDPPTDERIADIEQELGYKLPASYIWLMKRHNGGIPVNTCFPTSTPTSWAEDHVAISGIFGIGREKDYALCGSLGSQFMIDEWEYPAIGVAICDCPSAGHDMIFLDYRGCGPQGEPAVVHIDQESDYKITPLADNFEDFIRGLVSEDEYAQDPDERRNEELAKVLGAPFSPLLLELCQKNDDPDAVNQWIRDLAVRIVEDKGFFALHDDEASYALYDVQFWLYENAYPGVTEVGFLDIYPRIIQLANGFSTGGYAPGFITGWLEQRRNEGAILERDGALSPSDSLKARLMEQLSGVAAQLPHNLMEKIDGWHKQNRHRQIVEAILSRPKAARNDELLGQLAAAYNNLDECDKAIAVLESLRPRQENAPKFHYRLGYAYYYQTQVETENAQKRALLQKARTAFTRALMLNPPEEIAQDCREFLDWITEEYKETAEYQKQKEACGIQTPEVYTEQEMKAVESHIEAHFGAFENVWHELLSPDIHVDICVIPPNGTRDYYTLVTMRMGAHRMNVPQELAEQKLERAELVICLPADWKLGEQDEQWYWPARLLKQLARLPGECDTWLGWGHTVDNQEPYAKNTDLRGALLAGPQKAAKGAEVCTLPNGETVHFYQVIPLYADEMDYKKAHGAKALLDRLASMGCVVHPNRPDACTTEAPGEDEDAWDFIMDGAKAHLESIGEKSLPVDKITAYNHLAIYLRWCMEHDLMSADFLQRYGMLVGQTKAHPEKVLLREFLRDVLGGLLLLSYFNEQGAAFADYYYGKGDAPYFPADIDDYSMAYFGEARYHSDEFQDEAYLFVPFDEDYYQGMARVIDRRWSAWKQNGQSLEDAEPSDLAKAMIAYLGCPCRYFPPMTDDDPIMAAYGYAKRRGRRDGYIPMLITVNDTLWECLIMNSDPDSEGADDFAFDPVRVAQYRKATLTLPVKDGRGILEGLLGERRSEAADDDMDWDTEILGEISGGEENDRFLSFWCASTGKTLPLILAEIPVKSPWEVFAYLPFGGWNECPDTPELMAVAKYWHEQHGAVPAAITHDELEFALSAPVPREQAMRLAQEQYGFCPDVVDQGAEDATVGTLADTLSRSKAWYFWWD